MARAGREEDKKGAEVRTRMDGDDGDLVLLPMLHMSVHSDKVDSGLAMSISRHRPRDGPTDRPGHGGGDDELFLGLGGFEQKRVEGLE